MSKQRIAVLVSGGGSNLQALINAISEGSINGEIILVAADNVGAYALQRAKNSGIEALAIDKKSCGDRAEFDARLFDSLVSHKPDLIILAGYLSILPKQIVSEFEGRIINIHPSLIPAFCGKGFYGDKVHRAVLNYGAKVTGATVHFVDENTDTGPIILQQALQVLENDTPESLAARVLELEHRLIVKAAQLFCDGRLHIDGRRVRIL